MSTLKADTVTTKSDDTDLTITGGGTGVPNLEAGFKVGGSAGVPTASIQDDAVTLAKLAAGTDGELITWDASGDPATVAVGTATHVLTSNGAGAAPTFQAAGGGQWSLKASGTVSGAANLTISSITKRVFIFCQDVTMASTAELYLMTQPISSSSFPYLNWVDHSSHTGGTSITTIRGAGTTHMTLTAQQTVAAASNRMLNCWIELPDPANTVARQLLRYYSLFKIGDAYHSWGFGEQREDVAHADAGAIDVVKIEASTGNLSMGAYYVWEQG